MSKLAIHEFAPELLDLLKVAYRQEVQVPVTRRQDAVAMRYRINLLKSRIRESHWEDLLHLVKTQARIEPDPREQPNAPSYIVHVGPPDKNLTPFIRAALQGVEVPTDITDAPDLSSLLPGETVDTLPPGEGEAAESVGSEPYPLPTTHKE